MENKTQELKERIYALNPELKEMTMGSQIKKGDTVWTLWQERVDKQGFTMFNKEYISTYQHGDEIEILGHPIHLENILNSLSQPCCIDRNGIFYDVYNKMKPLNIGNAYELDKTFDQNCADNPELVDFLLEIIK